MGMRDENRDSDEDKESAFWQGCTGGVKTFPEMVGWLMLSVVSETLAFMHSKGVAHLDIRPANIFITHSEGLVSAIPGGLAYDTFDLLCAHLASGRLQLRVGDFGSCCLLSEPWKADEGEPRYFAKELLTDVDACTPSMSILSVIDSYSAACMSDCNSFADIFADKWAAPSASTDSTRYANEGVGNRSNSTSDIISSSVQVSSVPQVPPLAPKFVLDLTKAGEGMCV